MHFWEKLFLLLFRPTLIFENFWSLKNCDCREILLFNDVYPSFFYSTRVFLIYVVPHKALRQEFVNAKEVSENQGTDS